MGGLLLYSEFEPKSMHDTFPVEWKDAYSCTVYGEKGKEYIDFSSGIFVANVGHNNDHIIDSIVEYIRNDNPLFAFSFPNQARKDFIDKLIRSTPAYLDRCCLFCEGSMANEAAIRLAQAYTHKHYAQSDNAFEFKANVVRLPGAYHGNTYLLRHLPVLDELQPITAAIIIEGYEGWSAKFHERKNIQYICEVAHANDILVIFDEIQSGFGRTGKLFAFEHYGVKPDLVTFGKGVSSSLPLSGVLGRKEIMECLDGKELLSNTHSGSPLCCVAASASLDELEKLDFNEITQNGRKIKKKLDDIVKKYPKILDKAYGRGAIFSLIFKVSSLCDTVTLDCIEHGLMLVRTRKGSLKLGPPLTMPLDVWFEGIDIIDKVLENHENKRN